MMTALDRTRLTGGAIKRDFQNAKHFGSLFLLSLPLRASEVICDSEIHFVSEVSSTDEVMGKLYFTAAKP